MQFIEGFPLNEIPKRVAIDEIQHICEDAIEVINLVGQRDIYNEDVRLENFVVYFNEVKYKVFIIDFGLCLFRRESASEHHYWLVRANRDEEGCVGREMEDLTNGTGTFVYRRSEMYLQLDKTYMQ